MTGTSVSGHEDRLSLLLRLWTDGHDGDLALRLSVHRPSSCSSAPLTLTLFRFDHKSHEEGTDTDGQLTDGHEDGSEAGRGRHVAVALALRVGAQVLEHEQQDHVQDKDDQDDGSVRHEDAGVFTQGAVQADQTDGGQDGHDDDGTDGRVPLLLHQEEQQFLHRDPRSEQEDKESRDQDVLGVDQVEGRVGHGRLWEGWSTASTTTRSHCPGKRSGS